MSMPTLPLARLGAFRAELHACCTRRADALFDLADALLCAPAIPSVAHLSLEPAHRRGWGSAYAALASGRINADRLRDLLVRFLPDADPLVFAVDVTSWPRCDAECSPEHGFYYHLTALGRPTDRRWLGLPVDRPGQLRAGLLDRAGGCPPAARYDLKLWTGTLHESATYPPA